MSSEGAVVCEEPYLDVTTEDLIRSIESKTNRQVRDLEIDCRGTRVKVTGKSNTYYVKQLATQAIQSLVPQARLDNEIMVYAS